MRILVDSLTLSEMNELSNIIHERRSVIARQFKNPLNREEEFMIETGQWIMAIKAYRERNGTDLLTAKVKVDEYRDKLMNIRPSITPEG
jgi:ribosomal protein L7/L12